MPTKGVGFISGLTTTERGLIRSMARISPVALKKTLNTVGISWPLHYAIITVR